MCVEILPFMHVALYLDVTTVNWVLTNRKDQLVTSCSTSGYDKIWFQNTCRYKLVGLA